ncbi:DUF2061 domain-containing protein [Gammaproteobacteria bacterium]
METTIRRLLKAISWYLTGMLAVFLISWIITSNAKLAATIALTEVVTRFFLYWLHERIWNRTTWGRYNPKLPRL